MDGQASNTLVLPAVANLGAAAELAAQLETQLQGGTGPVQVDAGALQVYDTATVALLLQLRRLAQAANRPLTLKAAPDKLLQLASLYGVDELLGAPGTTPG